MDDQARHGYGLPYPQVANHIDDDPTPKDQAIYIPSVSPGLAITAFTQNWKRELPKGVGPGDLNFLDPNNKLFRISHAMTSAGQALSQKQDCLITARDRSKTIVIGDSGGYQIAHNRLTIQNDKDRLKILHWLERVADIAMTLDVPSGPVISNRDYKFKSTQDCLAATLEHLEFFQKNRNTGQGRIRFLNVIQGNSTKECLAWYDAVKKYDFEGWAIAGPMRHNFSYLCTLIIKMADEGQLQKKSWIHILGTCELEAAVMFTALQRAINEHINPDLRISYDTSSPFRLISNFLIYTIPAFDEKRMVLQSSRIPDGDHFIGSDYRWPWPSPLGDLLKIRDVCCQTNDGRNHCRDMQSGYYIQHHNLASLCYAIALANRVFDSESFSENRSIAIPTGAGVRAIYDVIKSNSMVMLGQYAPTFKNLRHSSEADGSDCDRDYD